jgi:hypothetical protein
MPDRIRYYREKNGNAFWAPGKQAEAFSFPASQPLGPAGEEAKKLAIGWNAKWDKRHEKRAPDYKPGTLGHFYSVFRTKTAWRIMDERTREDYERTWPEIERRFGKTLVHKISADDSERFHAEIHPAHNPKSEMSANAAHRTLKNWRALLNAMAAYNILAKAPIGRVPNPAPKGRSGVWTHDEVMQLSWAACVLDMPGMAVAIRLAWGAILSPVDVWTLPRSGWRDGLIDHERRKTGKRILVRVDADTLGLVNDYLATRTILPATPLIARANGKAYQSKDTFGDDFRVVRALAFPGDDRQFLDLRRSAATEARRGGATRDALGKAMANRVDASEALAATYLLDASDAVNAARLKARTA